jgi:adenylate cyclase
MGEDEAATVKTLEDYKQVMFSLIKQHRGRVIDSPGDNILAEFASVVDAVQCGVAIQKELQARNADLPENRKMQFRIGINLGDVIEEGERIYGDGVNIAARLESLADPGGICISKTAFDQIETKLPLGYHFLGEQTVKNIAKPVGAYKVLMEPRVTGAERRGQAKGVWFWRRKPVLTSAVAVLIVLIAAAAWNFYWRAPKVEPASKEKMALPLPELPSIAVLPFVNMSEDPKQEFLCDGITEDIITALSKVPRLLVIARNSTFTYKGKSVKIKQVSEELGVQYVLEGSVQKSADRIRITAQLIDALKGHHIWAERYDRDLKDLFALQDEITIKIITALQVKLTAGETVQLIAKSTKNLQAYLKVLEAREFFYTLTKEGIAQSRRLSEEAIALDPEYAPAYLYVGSAHLMDVRMGSSKSPEESLKLASEFMKKAMALDDSDSTAHSLLGYLYVSTKQYDKAISECERAVVLAPNSPTSNIWMGFVLTLAGRHEEALRYAEQALRFDPLPLGWYFRALGQAYAWVNRYEEAITAHKKALQRAPNDIMTHLELTTTYSWAGRLEEARSQGAEVLRINPNFSLEESEKRSLYKNKADRERYYDGLRKAGLPDKPPLPLPDKPSIAVLPFVNMSEDKSQEYFSDGITEDIITNLSKVSGILVISRNSSFLYKGKQVKIQEVAKDLGVRYVLEGSIRRGGDKIRLSAQLIDGKTEHHVWADSYDRELKDIFSVQDEVTRKVVSELAVALTATEADRLLRKKTENFEAYEMLLRARNEGYKMKKENFMKAMELAQRVIELDPKLAGGYSSLSLYLSISVRLGWSASPREDMEKAFELAQKAVSVDATSPGGYFSLASIYLIQGKHDDALAAANTAVGLIPGDADTMLWLGYYLHWVGRGEEAIEVIKKAREMNPKYLYGRNPQYLNFMGYACFTAGLYEESISNMKKSIEIHGSNVAVDPFLIASYSELGRKEEAKEAAQQLFKATPTFSLSSWQLRRLYKRLEDSERLYEALRKAGL